MKKRSPYFLASDETRPAMLELGQKLIKQFPTIDSYLEGLTATSAFDQLYKYSLDTTFDTWMKTKEFAETRAYSWRKQVRDLIISPPL